MKIEGQIEQLFVLIQWFLLKPPLVAIWGITMLAYIFFFFLDINRFAAPTKNVTSWTNADQSVPCVFFSYDYVILYGAKSQIIRFED